MKQRLNGIAIWALAALALACGVALASPAAAESTFSDVPGDHWAFDALDYLQEAGLVEGYPDGTFRGDRPFTRYEMAMVIARIYTKIQDWQSMMQNEGAGGAGASGDVQLDEVYARLDRLSDEFRDELSDLGARMTAVEDEQAKIRSEVDDLKGLLKESGISGEARIRVGAFPTAGDADVQSEAGFESRIQLNYQNQPDPDLDFNFSLTSTELQGGAGTAFIPGANNESAATNPAVAGRPLLLKDTGSSFIIDQAYFRYYWNDSPNFLGNCPVVTGGRQYFSQGEFGLAGDNGYRSNFGLRLDTDFGDQWSAYAGYYRVASSSKFAPFDNDVDSGFQSSATPRGDDYLLAGLEYHTGEGTVPGHDYKLAVRADFSPNGYGQEKYLSVSGNAEIDWFGDTWLNGIRGEWVFVPSNVAGQDPSADLSLTANSFIIEADVFNDGRSRLSVAGAQLAQIEGLPVFANIDNDPFSEWDFTVNQTLDAFNMSREGRNYFPSDFRGFGLQAQHDFGSALHSTLTYYQGTRVDATASERPSVLRLNLRYPFTDNSAFGVDFIAAGERSGFQNPISLVRGEFKINF